MSYANSLQTLRDSYRKRQRHGEKGRGGRRVRGAGDAHVTNGFIIDMTFTETTLLLTNGSAGR